MWTNECAFGQPERDAVHIVLIGYVFVTLLFSVAQYANGGLARVLIYLVFWTLLPTWFAIWVALVRRRNRRMRQEETAE